MALALLPVAAAIASSSIALAASRASSLKSSDHRARYGAAVRLHGSVPGESDATVRIVFRAAGHDAWRTVRQTRTDDTGDFRVRVRALKSGAFRAQPSGDAGPSDGSQTTSEPAEALTGTAEGSTATAGSSEPRHLRVVSRTHARVKRHAVIGHGVRIRGRVKPGTSHRRVKVKVGGDTLRTRTRHGGRFKAVWHPSRPGRFKATVRARGDRVAAGSRDRAGHVTVFRPAVASWYGPGFYGSRTACGQTLQASTLGVANKTLPCGTKLTLRYHGRQVKVRVIDRGPYAAGRDFDLTEATKQRLGFGSTGTLLSSK